MNGQRFYKEDSPWDGHRLISAFAELVSQDYKLIKECSNDFIDSTHQLRIYSVLCAVYDMKYDKDQMCKVLYDFSEGRFVQNFTGKEPEYDELCKYLAEKSSLDIEYADYALKTYNRYMFEHFMETRIASATFSCRNSGRLEGCMGTSVAYHVSNNFYSFMDKADNDIDDILLALMGLQGKFSIPVHRLIEYYRYPTTTDKELTDYWIDNL